MEAIQGKHGNSWCRLGKPLFHQTDPDEVADTYQVEKMFEITCTLTDVMACMSPTGLRSSSFDLGPQDYLKHLCTLIQGLPGGETKFLPLLLAKIGQTLPSMLSLVTRHIGLPVQDVISPKEVDIGSPIALGNDWNKAFNWAEMSRIGDKTPEIEGELELGLGL
jgi:alpha-glucosidase